MSNNNRVKIFSDMVSLDAWHERFTSKRLSVKLFADVSFNEARLGGEPDSKVRFRLNIRRAELCVIIPETEPVTVDKKTVSRWDSQTFALRKLKSTTKTKGVAGGGLAATLSATGVRGSAAINLGGSKTVEESEEKSITEKISAILVSHSLDSEGNNRWRLEANGTDRMRGHPWEAKSDSLLSFSLKESQKLDIFGPYVRLELWCQREDLIIEDIRIKEEKTWLATIGREGHDKRKIAAEAYIRTRLWETGLKTVNMSEPFSEIILAEIVATSE